MPLMPSTLYCDGVVEIHRVISFSRINANHTWLLLESVAFLVTRTVMSEPSLMIMSTLNSILKTMSHSTVAFTQVILTRNNLNET